MASVRHNLREMIRGTSLIEAPVVFNPLSAKLAEAAGFPALYLGGGGLGYIQCVTEANLTLTEMVRIGIDIRTVCPLPLILDGACGWGDPMHLHRTINMVEAAGFAGIEIEDQLLPKRAHHHIGIEHMIDAGLMSAKIREAAKARRDRDFVIIGRTNALRSSTMDDALSRADAYRAAGADVLLVMAHKAEHFRHLGERLAPPLTGRREEEEEEEEGGGWRRRAVTANSSPTVLGRGMRNGPDSGILTFVDERADALRSG